MANRSVAAAKHATIGTSGILIATTVAGSADPAVDEVQTLTIQGAPTGGTYTITYSGQTTSALAFDAVAATILAALEALSNLAPGDVVVTGGPLHTTPVVLTFGGTLAATNVDAVTASGTSLTGATTDVVAITGGASPRRIKITNRHATEILSYKVGESEPAVFAALADDSNVLLAGKDDTIVVNGTTAYVRVVGAATTYSVQSV